MVDLCDQLCSRGGPGWLIFQIPSVSKELWIAALCQ